MESKTEIWKSHPEIPGVEVSMFGNVRTLDRLISSEKYMRFVKGHVSKQHSVNGGYLQVSIPIDGKPTAKLVHRLVAQTFIPNPNNFPQINHKDCNRKNNNVENLEWCTASYNAKYRDKFGESQNKPVLAINLTTFEASWFKSQIEASRVLGVHDSNINNVIKGKYKQTGGFWFKEDDGNGIEINRDKLNNIMNGMYFRGGVFAINLNTLEVSNFKSQSEASRELGIFHSNINSVIKGRYKSTGGFWFTNADGNADDAIKLKLNEIKEAQSTREHVDTVVENSK